MNYIYFCNSLYEYKKQKIKNKQHKNNVLDMYNATTDYY